MELALVGCPQRAGACGGGAGVAQEVTTTAAPVTVAAAAGLGLGEKCTWVGWAWTYAPTFTMAGAGGKEINTANWQLHTMEYTAASSWSASAGSLQVNASTSGYIEAADALAPVSFLPTLTMPAAQFATLRTWYGRGGVDATD